MAHITDQATEVARGAAREKDTGRFGEQHHSAPDSTLAAPKTVTIVQQIELSDDAPIPYPDSIPAGGVVGAGFEDSNGRIFTFIDWDEETSPTGEPIHVSVGGFDEYDDRWDSLDSEPTGLGPVVEEEILSYLRDVQGHVSTNADIVMYSAAPDELVDSLVKMATGSTEPVDHSDEATQQRTVARGRQLVNAFGDPSGDDEDKAADAIADILEYARAKGIDIDGLIQKAVSYTED